jgi:trans-aconitate 2-methyltransferase
MAESRTRDWDATTYKRVALPHEEWARAVLDRLGLKGGESVLDAGCGSGRTTAIVIERLPEGRVIAVDGSPSMVEEVREVLRPGDEALVSDLTKLELEETVDAVFSTAVFHWILDHDALFARMRAALKDGGRFAAEPSAYAKTVCLGPYVERLPGDLRDQFVVDVLATQAEPLVLEYVRLNIEATAA